MNLKFLKFLVIFMGVLIVVGIIILFMGLYNKFNSLNNESNNSQAISIKTPEGFSINDYYLNNDNNIVIKYESNNNRFIYIYDILNGAILKKIELLK